MITPRYYQIEAHKATFDYLKNKEGNPLIALPTGTGKAMQLSMFVMNILMENPRQKILVVTHVSELIEQNAKELLNLWHTAPVGINSAALNRRDFNNNVIFCGIASIVKDWEKFGKVDFIIVDECFSGDTLISTPNGFKRIDQVSIGDVVYNAIGTGIVKSVSIKNTNTTYKVSLSNGTEITTTDNHPIFTQYGWIKARDLDKRHIVFSLQDLRKLRTKNIPVEKKSRYSKKWEVVQKSRKSPVTTSFRKNKILLNKLLETERECHVDSWSKRKNEGNINKNRSQTKNTRWEWKRINQSSRNYAKYTRGWMDFRIGYKNKSWTQQSSISELLQSGYREYRFKNSNRVGRWFTCREKKRTRQEKRQFSNFIRVEGVSIEKSRSSTSMFNLQVSGHPSYFAGGILVHNCHLISPKKETMYGSLISNLTKINPLLRVIGYTATPYRLGQGLLTDGGIFNNICYNLTDINGINNLIREGYMTTLIPPKTNYELDISGVNIGFDGDFAKVELQRAVDKYEITLAALKEARDRAEDRHCWLTFASGIEHCEHISEIQESLGISNVVIHSKITQKEREHRFNLWMTGKVKSVIGYRVLTTGLNHPPVDCIIDLYPTTSTSMHVQKLGRGTRPYNPDIQTKYRENFPYLKKNCLVLDFSRNTARLGPINDPVMPRKKGEKGSGGAPVKVCNTCGCYNHASARFCIGCNAEFTLEVKIKDEVSHAELIKSDVPELKTYKVDHITYSEHKKVGGKPSLKVSYFSGLKIFTEYVCIEHDVGSYPKRKADNWWLTRSGTTSPNSILSAIYITDQLLKPVSIIVNVNKKYPEIVDYIFNDKIQLTSKKEQPVLIELEDIPF